jgi:hypothetical protein
VLSSIEIEHPRIALDALAVNVRDTKNNSADGAITTTAPAADPSSAPPTRRRLAK